MNKFNWKKFVVVVILFGLSLSLMGCGGHSEQEEEEYYEYILFALGEGAVAMGTAIDSIQIMQSSANRAIWRSYGRDAVVAITTALRNTRDWDGTVTNEDWETSLAVAEYLMAQSGQALLTAADDFCQDSFVTAIDKLLEASKVYGELAEMLDK